MLRTGLPRTSAALLSFVLAGSLLVACKSKPSEPAAGAAPPAALRFVPADSPYFFVTLEGPPTAVMAQYLKDILPLQRDAMEASFAQAEALGDDVPAGPKLSLGLSRALVAELAEAKTPADLARLGLPERPRVVVWGLGLLPVLRVELKDEAAARSTVARMAAKVGATLAEQKLGDQAYWLQGEGGLRLLMAVAQGDLVVALLPTEQIPALLPQVLGQTAPAQTLVASGRLEALRKDYGFSPLGMGEFDLRLALAAVLDDPLGVHAALARLADTEIPKLDPACRKELSQVVALAPRAVFGFDEVSTTRFRSRGVLELRDDLAKGLAPLQTPIPGLSGEVSAAGALGFLGLGIDLAKVMDFVSRKANDVRAQPYTCPALADLNLWAEQANGLALQAPVPPVVLQSKGLALRVQSASLTGDQGPSAEFTAALRTAQPEVLVMMAQGLVPALAGMPTSKDGKVVPIPDLGGGLPWLKDAALAVKGEVLAVGAGAAGKAALPKAVEPGTGRPRLLVVSYDAGRVLALGESATSASMADLPPDTKAELERSLALSRRIQEYFGDSSYELSVTARGLELTQNTALRSPAPAPAAPKAP